LCQKSAIFSTSGFGVCTIRNSHRCLASSMVVFGENAPRVLTLTYPASPMCRSGSSSMSGFRRKSATTDTDRSW
jgi:hypothetical protein